ncbi:MAG: hypothetical protein ACXWX7_13125 [Candidatus Binatia bacterium]
MRKSLIIYALLLPLLLASSLRIAAAMSDGGSSSPWSNPVATTSELIDQDNGVTVGNLFTAAPRFDSVASCIAPTLGLTHWTQQDARPWDRPPILTLNQRLLI